MEDRSRGERNRSRKAGVVFPDPRGRVRGGPGRFYFSFSLPSWRRSGSPSGPSPSMGRQTRWARFPGFLLSLFLERGAEISKASSAVRLSLLFFCFVRNAVRVRYAVRFFIMNDSPAGVAYPSVDLQARRRQHEIGEDYHCLQTGSDRDSTKVEWRPDFQRKKLREDKIPSYLRRYFIKISVSGVGHKLFRKSLSIIRKKIKHSSLWGCLSRGGM